jgi:2-polyprenyl-3-methyl-5-hydroxy-6-metoxy-1,4-benzoquinol methylase
VILAADLERRVRQSRGESGGAIYATVIDVLAKRGAAGVLADVGCGAGRFCELVRDRFVRYIGIDALRFDGLPADVDFRAADLDVTALPIATGEVDVVVSLETIEHLENPRAFVRELVRITRPQGIVVVTTPNQLSALSLLTLVTRQQFSAFQENSYPAHRTALLETDLRRIAAESGLVDVEITYTTHGRMPLTSRHYPRALAHRLPRLLSDNVVLSARKPAR